MSKFIRVGSVEDVTPEEPLAVDIDDTPVAIFQVGDQYYAIENVCPHQGASFIGGAIDGKVVTCPLHGWRCDITTGASVETPAIKNETFEVKIEAGGIYVKT